MGWEQFGRGVFLVNCLGIIYDPAKGQILIGRRENDPHLKELTWCFPGGRPNYGEDLDEGLKREVKKKTGLDITVKKIVYARTYPEKKEFLSVYYACELAGGEEAYGDTFVELKWIHPKEVKDYFTTSVHSKVVEYLDLL
jgi:8-oxo-dGTP diphosphatase